MKKTNYFFNFISSYNKIIFKVIFFEIFYSIQFFELLPKIKVQNNYVRTDTVPCIYYFLHEISKFLKIKKIKSVVDIGSGYGRVVNFISQKNDINSYGIEYDKEVFKSSLKIKSENVDLYCGDAITFNLQKLNSNCFILNDPFKKIDERNKFLSKIKKLKPGKRKYIISINDNKKKFAKGFKLIHSIIGSKTRSLRIFEIY